MISKIPLLYLLFFTTLSLQCLKGSAATCNPDDEAGLLAFKSGITADPSGMLSTWKKGTDCCKWNTITCRADNRVTEIYLTGQYNNGSGVVKTSLTGTISPSLSKLKYLAGIYLLDLGNIMGSFPNFVFSLPNIKYIYIENNKLSGKIPVNIGKLSILEAISLEGNLFTGTIPSSITELTELTQLKLGGNRLTGTVPIGLQRLKNLTVLSLKSNKLSGNVPDFFSGFSELRVLALSGNKFTGKFPVSISALATKLRFLELGHNLLEGPIPDFLSNFHELDTLDLSWNRFSGTVPKSFANLTKIFNLDLSHNLLTDPFPKLYVKGIESLDLSYNQFHLGKIPDWVTTSPIIYSLKLAKCGIKMKLEDWKPSETQFYDYIDLSQNEITGSPVKILNRTEYLVGFYASGNKLEFNLSTVRFPKTLKYLDLSRNLVTGNVPKAIAGIENLNVSYNHLCGKLPATKFSASSFVGNDCLCGSPLPPCKV